mgnify:CR=1 FL=1
MVTIEQKSTYSEYQQPVEAEQGLNLEALILLRILTLHWQSALQQD